MASFRRVGRVIVVERDMKAIKVALVFMPDAVDQLLWRNALAFGTQHDRCAVGVVGAAIDALMPTHFLESYPDVGLNVFDQMAQVDTAVGIWQGGGDQNFACGGHE